MTRASSTPGLPRFIVIGAVKAATTWIQVQLQANPAVFLPDPEPHFFSRDFERGVEHYRRFFADAPQGALKGEKSADYLAHPLAPARIASLLPGVRLVAQLRDPVARAYSDYKMLHRRGQASGLPGEYLAGLDNPHPRFLNDGLYARHLRRWFDRFERESLLIFLHEDVSRNGRQVVERVSQHIGVAPFFDAELAQRKQNNSKERLLPLPLRNALAPLKQAARPLRGNPAFEFLRGKLAKPVDYPPLEPELEQRMRDFYLKDIEELEALLSLDLGKWKRVERRERGEDLSERGSVLS